MADPDTPIADAAGVTTVLLVRHAVHGRAPGVLWGRTPGVVLGEPGRAQARALARHLARLPVRALYASPRERCRETAAPLAAAAALALEVDPALDEIDYGAWTGVAHADLAYDPRWRHWNAARATAAPPGGEAMSAVQARVSAGLARWRERHAGGTVVAVTHADVVKAAVCGVLGLSLDRVDALDVDPASVTTLALWPGGGRLTGLNAPLDATPGAEP